MKKNEPIFDLLDVFCMYGQVHDIDMTGHTVDTESISY